MTAEPAQPERKNALDGASWCDGSLAGPPVTFSHGLSVTGYAVRGQRSREHCHILDRGDVDLTQCSAGCRGSQAEVQNMKVRSARPHLLYIAQKH